MTSVPADEKSYSRYNQYGENPMAPIAPIGLIPLKGSVEFTEKVNYYLTTRRSEYQQEAFVSKYPGFYRQDYRIEVENARFSSGEGKAVIKNTVRGHDLYIISDVMNPSITYKMYGQLNHMSPDDHYQDLKRVILACSGKARRINVIMPFLYESRQHKRNARESLDCAFIITFDAHDERVANAIPLSGFESLPSNYQMIKEMYRQIPDLSFTKGKFMVVSPDEGGIGRAMYYASILGVPLGTFYKRRDYTTVVNGRNPIIAHEFLGENIDGKDVIIIDDIISSGESMLEVARKLKELKARRIFVCCSFGLFCNGLEVFDEAYNDGVFEKVYTTNGIYQPPELLEKPWYESVELSKYLAYFLDTINHDLSVSSLLDSSSKIHQLLVNKGLK